MTNDNLTEVSALLDYYSGRAVAHASFFVASIFGTVTFLAIIASFKKDTFQDLSFPIVVIATVIYIGFSYLGYNSLLKFVLYAGISDKISKDALQEQVVFEKHGWRKTWDEDGKEIKPGVDVTKEMYQYHYNQNNVDIKTRQKWVDGKTIEYRSLQDHFEESLKRLRKYSIYERLSKEYSDSIQLLLGILYWIAMIFLGFISFFKLIQNTYAIWLITLNTYWIWLFAVIIALAILFIIPYYWKDKPIQSE
jgi:hypothetical protein